MSANISLCMAKSEKNDEFYTRHSDVEAELTHYAGHFAGKTVYLNCDDPARSAFWKYFHLNFERLGLKKLVSTHYEKNGVTYKMEYTGGNDGSVLSGVQENLLGDGDFRSPECVSILKRCDVVVGNPPFSCFRDMIRILTEHEKKFLLIGNINAALYKEIFPLIKDNRIWLGVRDLNKDMYFHVPDERKEWLVKNKREGSAYKVVDGEVMGRLASACWFTNLDHAKRYGRLTLFHTYTPEKYPKYDNYDAINVDRVSEIPADYDGVMGVPITFLDKYCPEQFEILGAFNHGKDGPWDFAPCNVGGTAKYKRIAIRRK